jgi:hypothetical protein
MADFHEDMALVSARIATRGRMMEQNLQDLQLGFAGLAEHLSELLQRENEMQAWRKRLEERVAGLEKHLRPDP